MSTPSPAPRIPEGLRAALNTEFLSELNLRMVRPQEPAPRVPRGWWALSPRSSGKVRRPGIPQGKDPELKDQGGTHTATGADHADTAELWEQDTGKHTFSPSWWAEHGHRSHCVPHDCVPPVDKVKG